MHDLHDCDTRCVVQFHWIPFISSRIQIEYRKSIFGIVVSIHETCSDKIPVTFALCKLKGVAVSGSIKEASDIPKLLLKVISIVLQWYAFADTSFCEAWIWNVALTCCFICVARVLCYPTINIDEAWQRKKQWLSKFHPNQYRC